MMRTSNIILVLAISYTAFSDTLVSEIDLINRRLKNIESMLETSQCCETRRKYDFCDRPSSCAEIFLQGSTESGIYTIYPRSLFRRGPGYKNMTLRVYCDMKTDGGGWTVFQRRDDYDTKENFFRNWADYQKGFGDLKKEFWLGNDNLYVLTNQDHVTLRVDLEDFEGSTRFAVYKSFRVADLKENFKADIEGYEGNAGDGLISGAKSAPFITYDKGDVNNCAELYKGAWWYTNCFTANLNGLYLKGSHTTVGNGVNWSPFKGYYYSLKRSEMKTRPLAFVNAT